MHMHYESKPLHSGPQDVALAFAWLSPSHWGHLRTESENENALCLSLSFFDLDFQVNKYIFKKNKTLKV